MEFKKILITKQEGSAYRLRVLYFLGLEMVFSFFWPVLLQHTPEEVEEYISRNDIKGQLAYSLRRWYFSGYSIYENGYFLGREEGSSLDYVNAYRRVQQKDKPTTNATPLTFYLMSTYRRPTPAVLQHNITDIRTFADVYAITPAEEKRLWEWVYRGKGIHENPGGEQGLNIIAWRRDFCRQMDEFYFKGEETIDSDDEELPF